MRLKPDFAQAFSDRGAAWYFKGEYQKAIADYDEAIRLEPDRARTYTNRGSAYRKLGRTDRALQDDTAAIRIDPSEPEFFDNRGLHLASNGDYQGAINDYDEAIRIHPTANFLTNRGDAYQARKDYDRAIADYDAALKLDPSLSAPTTTAARHGAARAIAAARCRTTPKRSASIPPTKPLPKITARLPSRSNGSARSVYQKILPSFNCATAKRQVEKAICADPGLAQLDRNINDVFLRVIASAEVRQPSRRAGADPAAARLYRQAQCVVRSPWL